MLYRTFNKTGEKASNNITVLPTITEIIIATKITAIIAINPGQPKTATNLLPNDIIIPARITPRATALTLVLKSKFKKLEANVPVQAPVPGSGIPTKRTTPQYPYFSIWPDFFITFFSSFVGTAAIHLILEFFRYN